MMTVLAGCTGTGISGATPSQTPTPQIIYVTVTVMPSPSAAQTAEPTISQEIRMDEAFIDYINENRIMEGMNALAATQEGSYSIGTGYNAVPKAEAVRLTELLLKAPKPGSAKMLTLRTAMMDALAVMDGSTAGFTRYRDAMQTVILANNAALAELHSAGSATVNAIHLSGRGNDIRWYNTTEPGLKLFTLHHEGDRNFAVTLKDEDDKYISLLANDIGDYSDKKTLQLAAGNYYLEITADGDWTIGVTEG
jgi:hypothetical protein